MTDFREGSLYLDGPYYRMPVFLLAMRKKTIAYVSAREARENPNISPSVSVHLVFEFFLIIARNMSFVELRSRSPVHHMRHCVYTVFEPFGERQLP